MTRPAKKVRYDTSAAATAQYYNTTGTVPSRFQISLDISYLISTQPNCTIVAFELPTDCTELEIHNLFSSYGPVKNMQRVCGRKAALIEFTEISSPTRLVHWAKINPFYIGSTQVRLEFSSQVINSPTNIKPFSLSSPVLEPNVSSILHLDITNADYPITVDVLKTICSPHAKPRKIFIGKKNVDKSLEALIEFANIDDARKVQENLHGADIYSGCCSLSVTFSKISKVHVTKNDAESWDYTDPNPSKEALLNNINGQKTLLGPVGTLKPCFPLPPETTVTLIPPAHAPYPLVRIPNTEPPYHSLRAPFPQQQNFHNFRPYPGTNTRCIPPPPTLCYPPITPDNPLPFCANPQIQCRMPTAIPPNYFRPPPPIYPSFNSSGSQLPAKYFPLSATPQIIPTPATIHHVTPTGIGIGHATSNLGASSSPNPHNTDLSYFKAEEGVVLMVSNLPPGVDCDHIFNVLCLYGNIARIKFLKSRPGCAMIQMGSKEAADLVFSYLNGAHVFGQTIQFYRSKQAELQEHAGLGTLADGSPVMKNYTNDPNNRFRNSIVAAKSRILTPSSTLHFFNAPLHFTPDDVRRVFAECSVKCPPRIVIFATKAGQKTSLGLVEWDTLSDALDALALANHHVIRISGFSHPFHLKLAFSPKPITDEHSFYSSISYSAPKVLHPRPVAPALAPINNGSGNIQSQTVVTVASTTSNQTIEENSSLYDPLGSQDVTIPGNFSSPSNNQSNSLNVDELEAEEAAYLASLSIKVPTTEVESCVSGCLAARTPPTDLPVSRSELPASDEEMTFVSNLESKESTTEVERVVSDTLLACTSPQARLDSASGLIIAAECGERDGSPLGVFHQPPATPPSEPDDGDD